MKRKFLMICMIILLPITAFGLTNKELALSINLAGKQRMLSQKITKEALLVKAGIAKDENLKKLIRSRNLFDKTLNAIINGDASLKIKASNDPKVKRELKAVQKIWKKFDSNIQKVINQTANKNSYIKIKTQNLELLKKMNKVVDLYVALSKTSTSKKAQAVNLSGKTRMLTQKMAKELLLISQGLDASKNKKNLQKTAKLFEKILRGLQYGDKSLQLESAKLPNIKKELKVGQNLWSQIKPTFQKSIYDKKTVNNTIFRLDILLSQMDKTVKLYEKSINREKQALKLSSLVNQYMQKKNLHSHVINLSGKQRMLTQKMTKLSLLIYLGVDKSKNIDKLRKSSKLYEKTLNGFISGDSSLGLPASKDKKIIASIKSLQQEWRLFEKNIQKIIKNDKKDIKALGYVIKNNEKLLKMSNQLVQTFKHSGEKQTFLEKARANIVDIAGKQRMLTQKMTKEKLLVLLKVETDANNKELQNTVSLFDTSLKTLIQGDANLKIVKPSNEKISKQLQTVAGIWEKLKPLYLEKKLEKKELAVIVSQNPILLAEMNKAVLLSETVADY